MSLEKEIARLTNALLAMNQILLHEAPQALKDQLAEVTESAGEEEDAAEQPAPPKAKAKEKEKPAKKVATKKPAKPEVPDVTREELRDLLKQVDRECGRAEVMTILKEYDANSLGQVDVGQYLLLKRSLESALQAAADE